MPMVLRSSRHLQLSKARRNLDDELEVVMSENGSRKRKMQTGEEPGECGEDGRVVHQSLSKLSQGEPKKTKSHHDYGGDFEATTHRYVVLLGDKTPQSEAGGSPVDGDSSCACPCGNSTELQFDCELGDIWINKYVNVKPHQSVSTGDAYADGILPNLESKGYSIQEQVARGKFGSILLAYSKVHSKFVAIKFIVKNSKRRMRRTSSTVTVPSPTTEIPEEITILQKLRHRNIAEMLEYHMINGRICLVMEFCENGNMEQLLSMRPSGFLPEAIARQYFRDMIDAIEYIHSQLIVHRDIKCQNFVLDRHDCVKLCDLASARQYRPGDGWFLGSGSPGYQSPEVLEGKLCDPRSVDLWAMAVVLFVMLTSKMPFGKDTAAEMLKCMRKGVDFSSAASSLRLSSDVTYGLKHMLHYLPEERYSLNRIKNCPWYRTEDKRVFIGNYHLVQYPQKRKEGSIERQLKESLNI